ncbi:ABC transporter ATP-binding protein [Christensenella tenuis]|nr:ATP-binding cassette domain-containing protein [Christensenella tenuis]
MSVNAQHFDIAMVFQNYALYPHMTVFENMAFALKLKKLNKQVIAAKVREAAEILGIEDLLERKPKALSGGQRQRVAIGRAIVREPKVFLMDEPLSNLDAKLRNQMRSEIIKLRQRINTTFIYVTHDQTEAMTLGDRIVIMKDGHIQQIGTPQQVFNEPANLFVAEFIGTPKMNIFPAHLKIQDNKYYVAAGSYCVQVPEKYQKLFQQNQAPERDLLMGVRPENTCLSQPGGNAIEATVDVNEMMSSELYIHIQFCGEDIILRLPMLEVQKTYGTLGIGQKIHFSFEENFIHLFDPDTGANLMGIEKETDAIEEQTAS